MRSEFNGKRFRNWFFLLAGAGLFVTVWACTTNPGGGPGGVTDGGTTDDNALLNDALGYNGSISGKIVDNQSTRTSTTDASAAQELPEDFDPADTCVRFMDVLGNELIDPATGAPYPCVPLEPDGSFEADDLPVGTDFTICGDIGMDGDCEVQSCVNIPSTNGGEEGHLGDVQADPLTTIILAKLQALVEERGIDPTQLPISPVALVARVVEAYIHLFEESGIEHELTLEDVESLTAEQLAALFDAVIPAGVQAGMQVVGGNLDLAVAEDVNALALAAANVFLAAGFPIADQPEGLDLSQLSAIDGVTSATFDEFRVLRQPPMQGETDGVEGPIDPAPAGIGEAGVQPTIYYNTLSEPDRNFAEGEAEGAGGGPHLPIIHDYLLLQMAQLQLEGRRITIGDLHRVLTSLDNGLGARLTYFIFNPNFFGPPLNVFETADGRGKAIGIHDLFARVEAEGFQSLDRAGFEEREEDFRTLLRELLVDTIEPSLDRLAGAFLDEQISGVEELSSHIRDARAHLPFSRTGPSTFFVVADGDPFNSDASVSAITVDAEVDTDGRVLSVTYNAAGEGKYNLHFTHGTQSEGTVGLLVRETGRTLHGIGGPASLNLHDDSIFNAIDGQPFAAFVSATGDFFPGVNVPVVSDEFVPEPVDETVVSTAELELVGPTQQIFVLATSPGPGAEPVRVDYDFATGVATYNSGGRNLLQFLPDTQETGQFALFNEKTGRPARDSDPSDFFEAPPIIPEDLEEIFNSPEGQDVLEDLLGDVVVDAPVDGQTTPTDGTTDTTTDGAPAPAEVVVTDGTTGDVPFGGVVDEFGRILVSIDNVIGLPVRRENFTHVFGTDVPNARYNPEGDPYFDDVSADGIQDADEPTSPFRPTLFNPLDWRSTDIRLYYRRTDNGAAVTFEEVDFMSPTPKTLDGVDLEARNFVPRLNAYRFGRPNTALNLLSAFLPPEFFDGAHGLTAETSLDIFGAIAVLNLMMDQVLNVEAEVDVDGLGPLPSQHILIDAHIFVAPLGDPFVLLFKGFQDRSAVTEPTEEEDSSVVETTEEDSTVVESTE